MAPGVPRCGCDVPVSAFIFSCSLPLCLCVFKWHSPCVPLTMSKFSTSKDVSHIGLGPTLMILLNWITSVYILFCNKVTLTGPGGLGLFWWDTIQPVTVVEDLEGPGAQAWSTLPPTISSPTGSVHISPGAAHWSIHLPACSYLQTCSQLPCLDSFSISLSKPTSSEGLPLISEMLRLWAHSLSPSASSSPHAKSRVREPEALSLAISIFPQHHPCPGFLLSWGISMKGEAEP